MPPSHTIVTADWLRRCGKGKTKTNTKQQQQQQQHEAAAAAAEEEPGPAPPAGLADDKKRGVENELTGAGGGAGAGVGDLTRGQRNAKRRCL
jgi:hypothetical protein